MNKELKGLSLLAKNNNLKLLPVMRKKELKSVVKQLLDAVAEQNVRITKLEYPPRVEKKELEVGKWYKGNVDFNSMIYITELENAGSFNRIHGYGFKKSEWNDLCHLLSNTEHEESLIEATSQEVESALIEEAKRRGYKVGNSKCLNDGKIWGFDGGQGFHFTMGDNLLFLDASVVFKNGIWATIIEQDKFYELKEAHKNGAVIESMPKKWIGDWTIATNPIWDGDNYEYRIKPSFEELPKPNVLVWAKRKDGVYLAKRNGNPRSKNQDPSKNCDWNGIRFDEIINPSDHNSGVHFPCYFSDITVEEWRYIEQTKWNEDAEYRIKPEDKPKVGDVVKAWNEDNGFVVGVVHRIEYVANNKFGLILQGSMTELYMNFKPLTQQETIDLLFNDKS